MNLNEIRDLAVAHLESFFDALDAIAQTEQAHVRKQLNQNTESSYGFELLDDDDDYGDEQWFNDDYTDESQEDTPSWPNLGPKPQPKVAWPNVGTGPAKPKVAWPNVGSLVGNPPVGVVADVHPSANIHQSTHMTPTGPIVKTHSVAKPTDMSQTIDTDGRGRACVPAALVAHCGFKPHDQVYVSVRAHKQPGLVLLKTPSQTGHLSTYTVDKDGNIRLSHFVLSQGNLGAATRVKFKADKSRIVVLQG